MTNSTFFSTSTWWSSCFKFVQVEASLWCLSTRSTTRCLTKTLTFWGVLGIASGFRINELCLCWRIFTCRSTQSYGCKIPFKSIYSIWAPIIFINAFISGWNYLTSLQFILNYDMYINISCILLSYILRYTGKLGFISNIPLAKSIWKRIPIRTSPKTTLIFLTRIVKTIQINRNKEG